LLFQPSFPLFLLGLAIEILDAGKYAGIQVVSSCRLDRMCPVTLCVFILVWSDNLVVPRLPILIVTLAKFLEREVSLCDYACASSRRIGGRRRGGGREGAWRTAAGRRVH
jgi:hypothetical protein